MRGAGKPAATLLHCGPGSQRLANCITRGASTPIVNIVATGDYHRPNDPRSPPTPKAGRAASAGAHGVDAATVGPTRRAVQRR